MGPRTGQGAVSTGNGGSAAIQIVGQIVDDVGNIFGDFYQTSIEAIDGWKKERRKELAAAGVPLQ